LRKLAKQQNKLILFSSHDWRLAKEFADKIWYVKDHHLYAGIVEDVLLQHDELTDASLFQVDQDFVAPSIVAPQIQKEMLYSFLQKNFRKNLSHLHFEFKDSFWEISDPLQKQKCESFEEMLNFVSNLY
ncbi:MAG: ABC transporter ATP-binding protein, partial [Chryseobacterium sp.]